MPKPISAPIDDMTELQVHKTQSHTTTYVLHRHACWEMLYYTENSGMLCFDDREPIPFHPGTLICVPPGIKHGSTSTSGDFVDICVVDPEFPFAELSNGNVIVAEDNASYDLLRLFSMIYRIKNDRPGGWLNTLRRMRNLLNCVYDAIGELLSNGQKPTDAVEGIKTRIREQYMDPSFTAAEAVRESGYSQNYMRGQFFEQCGVTPAQYLVDMRMECARWLIESYGCTISIAEIAHRSGFADPLYFSKVFRKHYGQPPSKYAKLRLLK